MKSIETRAEPLPYRGSTKMGRTHDIVLPDRPDFDVVGGWQAVHRNDDPVSTSIAGRSSQPRCKTRL